MFEETTPVDALEELIAWIGVACFFAGMLLGGLT